MMTFRQFLWSWRNGKLDDDVTWRAYDFTVRPVQHGVYVQRALKAMGLRYAGELAIPEFMARYEIKDRADAEAILWSWVRWWLVAQGRRVSGLRPREGLPLPTA